MAPLNLERVLVEFQHFFGGGLSRPISQAIQFFHSISLRSWRSDLSTPLTRNEAECQLPSKPVVAPFVHHVPVHLIQNYIILHTEDIELVELEL